MEVSNNSPSDPAAWLAEVTKVTETHCTVRQSRSRQSASCRWLSSYDARGNRPVDLALSVRPSTPSRRQARPDCCSSYECFLLRSPLQGQGLNDRVHLAIAAASKPAQSAALNLHLVHVLSALQIQPDISAALCVQVKFPFHDTGHDTVEVGSFSAADPDLAAGLL